MRQFSFSDSLALPTLQSWDHRYVHMAVQSDEVLATPWFIFGKSHFSPLLLQSRRQGFIHCWPRH